MDFICQFFCSKGTNNLRWLREEKQHYLRLSHIQNHLGMNSLSSEGSEGLLSNSDTGDKSLALRRSKPRRTVKEEKKIRVAPSIGKETELFDVILKNVNNLEMVLPSSDLGKSTDSLFWKQFDDMMVYPCYSNNNILESLGNIVEAVTNMNHHSQGWKGGTMDTAWKNKGRNAMKYMKISGDLNTAL